MRHCEAVRNELSAPTGAVGAVELSEHLAACPVCASWGEQARAFDALWAATRPEVAEAEDDPEGWDAAWARIAPASEAVRRERDDQYRRSRRIWATVGLAQAAAILLAVGLWSRMDGRRGGGDLAEKPEAAPPAAPLTIVLSEGEMGFLHLGDGGMRVENTPLGQGDDDLALADFEILNHMEGLAP